MKFLSHVIFYLSLLLTVGLTNAEPHLQNFEQQLKDSLITAKITAKYTESRTLNPLKITVATHQGVVVLTGHVKDRAAYIEAFKLANTTAGVKLVKAQALIVKEVNTSFGDAYITAKVETAILKAKVFDDESIPLVGINAATSNGTVTLSGKVQSEKSLQAILKRIRAVHGVKKVISRLEVSKNSEA